MSQAADATCGIALPHPAIDTPAVLLDLGILERDIAATSARASRAGVVERRIALEGRGRNR